MAKRNRRAVKPFSILSGRETLIAAIRRIATTLTVPTLLIGCSHQPSSVASLNSATSKRVFHVFTHREPGSSPDAASAAEPSDNSQPSPSAGGEIIESISDGQGQPWLPAKNRVGAQWKSRASHRQAPLAAKFRSKPKLLRQMSAKEDAFAAALVGPMPPSGLEAGKLRPATLQATAKPSKYKKNDVGWDRFRDRLILAGIEHDRVSAQIEEFRRQPGSFEFLARRAEPYLQYLLSEIDRRQLPPDLLLVPMVESAFDPAAVSPKQAAGLWQFIPATGQQYGLTQTDGYDGRHDVHASTLAALSYLKHLVALFKGDWLLALAAYNAGEGAVQRAIDANAKANIGTAFWDLNLPAETKAYVPKIVALAKILANPEVHGFKPRAGKGASSLARIEIGPEIKMADVVTVTAMPPADFYKLNPAFKIDIDPPAGKTYSLLLPYDRAEMLATNLAGTKFLAARWIIVKKGETLSVLAKRHGVPEIKLAEWNGLRPKQTLKAGQELVVLPV